MRDDDVSLTRQAARRLLDRSDERLSPELQSKVAICLLDHFACCLDGLDLLPGKAARQVVGGRPARPEAHAWGIADPIAAGDAAFANAMLAHSLIRDDMHIGSGGHIGVLVLPAILALAQREGLSGLALSRGIVAGYSMAAHLGLAIRTGARIHHFRPSGIMGAFGVAAAAVAASRPDEDQAVHALGLAANSAAGLNEWPWSGGQEIYLHAGLAARNGIAAFDLAGAGLAASERVLEGRDGMFVAYGAGPDARALFLHGLGQQDAILDVRHKPFAGCNYIQTPIGAALELRGRVGLDPAEIRSVTIHTFTVAQEYPGCDSVGPFTSVQQSKMSIQYGVAAALLRGQVDEAAYAALSDAALAQMVSRCQVEIEAEMESAFPVSQPARVSVVLRNGECLASGLDDVPWLSDAAVEARFRMAAAGRLSPVSTDRIVAAARTLCTLPDARTLLAQFATCQAGADTPRRAHG